MEKLAYTFNRNYRLPGLGRHLSLIYKNLSLNDSIDRVLDLCCGEGRLLACNNRKFSIYGIDQDACGLEIASSRKNETDFIEAQDLSVDKSLHYDDEFFDAIIFWRALHYFEPDTRKKLISEIGRVLKKDGVLYLSTYSKSDWKYVETPAALKTQEAIDCSGFYSDVKTVFPLRFFSRSGLEKEFQGMPFEIISMEEFREKSGFKCVNKFNTYWLVKAVKK